MEITELKQNWDVLGKTDPFWAILSDPNKKDGKWDEEEFFRTGGKGITNLFEYIESLNIKIPGRKALDFGCGVGRLTQALCKSFDQCYGIDIAASMIELANKYNKYGERCRYILNESNDLKMFEKDSFDFILTLLVLQHMRPEYSKNYIKEFIRVLSPGGLLVFQIPSEPVPDPVQSKLQRSVTFMNKLCDFVTRLVKTKVQSQFVPKIEMYGVKKDEVIELIKENGGKVVAVIENKMAGKEWYSFSYFVTK